ncbi:hypothetical protein ATANTOWER_028362 [Ataeniobius toweri]|uniref:Uncharacterized protein n=1 Tax=Ataeniobius toweri TaxID=208326 RepID=A0ABU7A979_9TELE|nr:hypothetical protein [Ataeniobius toweri]
MRRTLQPTKVAQENNPALTEPSPQHRNLTLTEARVTAASPEVLTETSLLSSQLLSACLSSAPSWKAEDVA